MKKPLLLLLPLAALLAFARPAAAWNKAGHMLSGALAWKELAEGPRAKAVELLKSHPAYAKWTAEIDTMEVPADQRGEYLFMAAARWPDDARKTPDDNPTAHYVDYPYVPPGQPKTVKAPPPDPKENAELAFRRYEKTARDPKQPAAERAKALCWVFHLIGDGHQPLHTVTLYSQQFPEGDRGGNRFFVHAKDRVSVVNLHSLWDGLLGNRSRFREVDQEAIKLRARDDLQRPKLPELKSKRYEDWTGKESFGLAKSAAYLDGKLKSGPDKKTGEELPEDYPKASKSVAERRMALAGYRLADWLAETFR